MSFKKDDRHSIEVLITDEMVQKFADVSGDRNPIHLDDEYAKTTRFGRRIAHGMLAGALISRALGNELGSGGIYLGQTMKFTHPVYIGDTLKIELFVVNVRERSGIALIETTCTNQLGEVCVKGEATIMKKEGIQG